MIQAAVVAPITRWTLAEAVAEFPALSELAEQHGFRASMFGSVLIAGGGNDLDLLLSPFGSLPNSEVQFLAKFGGVLKETRFAPSHNVRAFKVEKNGRLYDFVFGGFWKPRRKQ